MTPQTSQRERIAAALDTLADALAAQRFGVPDPERDERRARRDRLVADLRGHRTRLDHWEAPLLAVVAGGTGAGKSTVVNSLVGRAVSPTGVIRPTTTAPTLLANPSDRPWFDDDRVLPGLARVDRAPGATAATGRELVVFPSHAVPSGLGILDTPDIDSVRTANRDLAEELLDAADVWVWLVTPWTYADADGMAYLRRAARRRTPLTVVLSQAHRRDTEELVDDLRAKLGATGLGGVDVLTVPASRVEGERLPDHAVAVLRRWLRGLAEPDARRRLRTQTIAGALDDVAHEADPLLAAVDAEEGTVALLREHAALEHGRVPDQFTQALDDGLPLRGEVLARWRDLVGTSRFVTMVESATGLVRNWLKEGLSTVTGAEEERVQRQVRAEVADTVAGLAVQACEVAATETVARWEASHPGRALLVEHPELRRPAPGVRERAEAAVADWQEAVAELVRTRGAERRVRARWMSTLVNAGATAAILLAFATSGGLTGAEAGIAAGASAANQALLAKLLGTHNLNWLLARVREDLRDRVTGLAATERARYDEAVDAVAPDPRARARLVSALAELEAARS